MTNGERDDKPDNLVVIGGDGRLQAWNPETEQSARNLFEELLRDYEQVFVFGIRRVPDRPWCTETHYQYQHRLVRTSCDEFMGALKRILPQLEAETEDMEP